MSLLAHTRLVHRHDLYFSRGSSHSVCCSTGVLASFRARPSRTGQLRGVKKRFDVFPFFKFWHEVLRVVIVFGVTEFWGLALTSGPVGSGSDFLAWVSRLGLCVAKTALCISLVERCNAYHCSSAYRTASGDTPRHDLSLFGVQVVPLGPQSLPAVGFVS